MTFEITGKEPHEPDEMFTIYVSARNEREARRFVRWNFRLPKGTKLDCFPTNNDPEYFSDEHSR